jgi:hypothetical protein
MQATVRIVPFNLLKPHSSQARRPSCGPPYVLREVVHDALKRIEAERLPNRRTQVGKSAAPETDRRGSARDQAPE